MTIAERGLRSRTYVYCQARVKVVSCSDIYLFEGLDSISNGKARTTDVPTVRNSHQLGFLVRWLRHFEVRFPCCRLIRML